MKRVFCLILSLFFAVTLYANDKIIAIYRPEGISIIQPEWDNKKASETETEFLERVYQDAVKNTGLIGYDYETIATQDLPSREYRDAWEKGSGNDKIKINNQKKQEIIDKKNKKINAKNKLKTGTPLTDEDIKELFGE